MGHSEGCEESLKDSSAKASGGRNFPFILLFNRLSMCGDTNCQTHDCCGGHGNYKCHCHEHEEFDYNGYRDGDIVGEADFQIVDRYEFDEMRNNGVVGGNLGDDLVNMGFIDKNSPLYDEMKNEGREGMFYEE